MVLLDFVVLLLLDFVERTSEGNTGSASKEHRSPRLCCLASCLCKKPWIIRCHRGVLSLWAGPAARLRPTLVKKKKRKASLGNKISIV